MSEHAPPSPPPHDESLERIERIERRWAALAVAALLLIVVVATYGGIHQATMPQLVLQTVNPLALHVQGEFIESNLGSTLDPDGSVTVRVVAQQYSFTPQCILVPTATPVTFRATSSDVVHGFLIDGTNVNTMLVPGYVTTITTRFNSPGERHMPCHEYCGVGHEGMWANVKVIDRQDFLRMAADRRRLDCVK